MTPNNLAYLHDIPFLTANRIAACQDTMFANVDSVLNMASDNDITEGKTWYTRANYFARNLAERHDLTLAQAAGIVSALSPSVTWEKNQEIAETIITDPYAKIPGYGLSKWKAQQILFGASPTEVIGIGDKKTYHFYRNLMYPYCDRFVTADVWIVRAILLFPDHSRNASAKIIGTAGKYKLVVQIFERLAKSLGILPLQCQAIAWVTYRRIHGKNRG